MNLARFRATLVSGGWFLFFILVLDVPAVASSDAADLTQVLPVLQARYLDFKDLNYREGDQLDTLIERSHGRMSLQLPGESGASEPTFISFLPGSILYWRLGTFTPEKSWNNFMGDLEQKGSRAVGLILDLRSSHAPNDFAGAAQVAAGLSEKPMPLTLEGGNGPLSMPKPALSAHPLRLPMVLLIDCHTGGAAEVLADSLEKTGAVVIGRSTPGRAGVFEEQRLPSGQVLRYLVGRVFLEGRDLWNHPLTPDIAVSVPDDDENKDLALIAQGRVLDVIRDPAARHRLTEAALVRNEEPETDDYLASFEDQAVSAAGAMPKLDLALVEAMDSLKAIHISEQQVTLPSTAREPAFRSATVQ